MNKKVIGFIVAIFVVVIGITVWFLLTSENSSNAEEGEQSINENASENENVAIVYFSATGNTKMVAQYIQEETGGTLFEIEPEEKYTDRDLDYNNDDCRANEEQNDPSARPKVKDKIEHVEMYDKVALGFPVWWGVAPRVVNTFLEENNLVGKKIYVFVTSGGSSSKESYEDLKRTYPNLTFVNHRRFTGNEDKNEYIKWISE